MNLKWNLTSTPTLATQAPVALMAPTTQKALIIPAEKESFKLVTDWPVPQPSPTDVLVKLVSVALNPVDAFVQAQGIPGLVPGYPCVVGFDGAGTVEEVGADVANVVKGDKVYVAPIFLATVYIHIVTYVWKGLFRAPSTSTTPTRRSKSTPSSRPNMSRRCVSAACVIYRVL